MSLSQLALTLAALRSAWDELLQDSAALEEDGAAEATRFLNALTEWHSVWLAGERHPIQMAQMAAYSPLPDDYGGLDLAKFNRQQAELTARACAALQEIADTYRATAKLLEHYNIDSAPLLHWANNQHPADVPVLCTLLQQASVRRRLAWEKLRRGMDSQHARLQQAKEQALTQRETGARGTMRLEDNEPASDGGAPRGDGPFDGDSFAWKGKVCDKLTTLDYAMLSYFWDGGRLLASATYDELIERVWGKEVEWSTVKSQVTRLNEKLNLGGIYLGWETSSQYYVRVTVFREAKSKSRGRA